jgi:predicted ATP-grasp superfamily ATP-dependent carboligase
MIDNLPSVVAIHEAKLMYPIGIYYNKKHNLVILHVVTNVQGNEWQLAEATIEVAKSLNAKEFLSIEGVGSTNPADDTRIFFYTNKPSNAKHFEDIKIPVLKEGIVMGVTAALLVEADDFPLSCIFAEAHSQLPDSKAAAKVMEVLDKYLNLKIDYKPLLKQAEKFEEKLKRIMQQSKVSEDEHDKKMMSYVG